MNQPQQYPMTEGVAMPHPEGYVASYFVTYVHGHGMRVRVVNVPGSRDDLFRDETEDYVCQCNPPAIYHFTAVDGGRCATYATMNAHEAVSLMSNPHLLLEDPESLWIPVDDDDDELEEVGLGGILTPTTTPLIPEGEPLELVIAELLDELTDAGADLDEYGVTEDRIRVADVIDAPEVMADLMDDFKKLLEEK